MSSLLSLILREYRRKLLKKVRPAAVRDPWMRYWEIEIVEDVLRALAPRRCLEWGSGFSTLRFSSLLAPDAHWLSIEHDRAWHARVQDMLAAADGSRAEVELRCAPPRREPWTEALGDGSVEDFADYIELPQARGPFDFILVDGRARMDCLAVARDLVHPDGVVLLHDANRKHYHAAFRLYPHQAAFLDHRPRAGGLWLGSVGRPLEALIDIDAHRARWRRASLASKLLLV